MSSRNPYVDLCLEVQAVRRDVECVRTPLAAALGVAASVYTHQLANVHRVLTDLHVRHLLADEVGLGKTVQALMILNALKLQRPALRALVIVPDRLVGQWRDEILTRAHTAPVGDDANVEGGQYIRLAWEQLLRSKGAAGGASFALADIDPQRYEVLIVDELHKLRADLQERITRAAPAFRHLLLLTATPEFQDPKRHAQLFAALEPARVGSARWEIARASLDVASALSVSDDLSKWPEPAQKAIVDALIERDEEGYARVVEVDEEGGALGAALAHCAYRRIIRTRREDYGAVLPRRRHRPIVVNPLGAEARRQELMWKYFSHLGELTRDFDRVLLAKRVVLSPPSLEQRVDFLRRKGHERGGLLEEVKPLVHRSQGDSRLDALIDLLADVWREDPTERVLVAAQDNLTVDYIFDVVQARLPLVGPLGAQRPLQVARIRQGMAEEMLEDLGGHGNDTSENLEAFQRGEAQLLIAPEKGQVGLNLQRARVLVLYSVPWRPEEVEQWIGRMDRIGNPAAFDDSEGGRFIDVYTITQRGLVDDKVVGVLQHFNVFERSVNLDGAHLQEVTQLIEDAALRPAQVNWEALEDATEAMAAEDEVQELRSALSGALPWSLEQARALKRQLNELPPVAPALKTADDGGPRAWDRALEGMIELLDRAGEYNIRTNRDADHGARFRTLWYTFGERQLYGKKEVLSRVKFSFGADPAHERSPRFAHAFITRRSDIRSPPLRKVMMNLNGELAPRPLRFLNFGNPLHDELISGWLPEHGETRGMTLSLPDEHPFFEHGAAGVYVVRLVTLDPADALDHALEERAARAVADASRHVAIHKLPQLMEPFTQRLQDALEADSRWLRALLPAQLRLEGRRLARGGAEQVSEEALCALLNPLLEKGRGVRRAASWQPKEELLADLGAALDALRGKDPELINGAWSHLFPEVEREAALRRHVAQEEGRDFTLLAQLELEEEERRLSVARERGNPGQQTRAQNVRDEAAEVAAMTAALWAQRCLWLEECLSLVRALAPRERLTAVIRVKRA